MLPPMPTTDGLCLRASLRPLEDLQSAQRQGLSTFKNHQMYARPQSMKCYKQLCCKGCKIKPASLEGVLCQQHTLPAAHAYIDEDAKSGKPLSNACLEVRLSMRQCSRMHAWRHADSHWHEIQAELFWA